MHARPILDALWVAATAVDDDAAVAADCKGARASRLEGRRVVSDDDCDAGTPFLFVAIDKSVGLLWMRKCGCRESNCKVCESENGEGGRELVCLRCGRAVCATRRRLSSCIVGVGVGVDGRRFARRRIKRKRARSHLDLTHIHTYTTHQTRTHTQRATRACAHDNRKLSLRRSRPSLSLLSLSLLARAPARERREARRRA
jgi:hypothetical protein